MNRTVTAVETAIIVPGLTSEMVDRAMDDTSALHKGLPDVLDWSVSADLSASLLTVELVLDFDNVDEGMARSRELVRLIAGGTVQHWAADLVAA